MSSLYDAMLAQARFSGLTEQQKSDARIFMEECERTLDMVLSAEATRLAKLLTQVMVDSPTREDIAGWFRGELGKTPR